MTSNALRSVTTSELFQKAENLHYLCATTPGPTIEQDGVPASKEKALREVARMYDAVLAVMMRHESADAWRPLYRLGTVFHDWNLHGSAIALLEMAANLNFQFGPIWNSLGVSYRGAKQDDKAERAFKMAAELMPDDSHLPANISGLLINMGRSAEVVEWADKSLALDPSNQLARWHKALGLLEQQKWAEAWPYHEARHDTSSNCNMARRNYHSDKETPWWDGKTKGRVVIHGEQGLGDEIMFASCLPDAIATGAEIIVECAPRNENLFKRSFPGVHVVGTHKTDGQEWMPLIGEPDFKSALGSLPMFYRQNEAAFPKTPYLKADPEKRRKWRLELDALGEHPKVGIAWQGGHHNTRVDLRSVHLPLLSPILRQKANFVSLQYTKAAKAECEQLKADTGLTIHHWSKAAEAQDLEDVAALIAELDLVISVCQTAIHIAGGLGTPCWVLTPSAPAWRYATTDRTDMAWYGPHLRLVRQARGQDWGEVIQTVAKDLGVWLQSC